MIITGKNVRKIEKLAENAGMSGPAMMSHILAYIGSGLRTGYMEDATEDLCRFLQRMVMMQEDDTKDEE